MKLKNKPAYQRWLKPGSLRRVNFGSCLASSLTRAVSPEATGIIALHTRTPCRAAQCKVVAQRKVRRGFIRGCRTGWLALNELNRAPVVNPPAPRLSVRQPLLTTVWLGAEGVLIMRRLPLPTRFARIPCIRISHLHSHRRRIPRCDTKYHPTHIYGIENLGSLPLWASNRLMFRPILSWVPCASHFPFSNPPPRPRPPFPIHLQLLKREVGRGGG